MKLDIFVITYILALSFTLVTWFMNWKQLQAESPSKMIFYAFSVAVFVIAFIPMVNMIYTFVCLFHAINKNKTGLPYVS